MNTRVSLILIVCITCLTLTGCWDREELNDIALVSGMAIDKGEKELYKLTIESLNAAELNPKSKGEGTPSVVFSLEGPSISELSRKMNIGLSRKLLLSHMRVVVIHEDVARKGLLEFLDFMERDREIRNDFNIVIATKTTAASMLTVLYPLQKVSTNKIHVQLETSYKNWGGDPNVRLKDFVNALISKGREPVAATISIEGDAKKGGITDNIQKVKPDALVKLEGMSVFKNDKLLGILPIQSARDYLWTQNKLKMTSLSPPCGKNKYLDLRVYHSHTTVNAHYQKGKPVIGVHIVVETRLDGTHCSDDLTKVGTYTKYEKITADFVRKEVQSLITTIQKKYKADIFGFGEKMHIQDPKHYNKVKEHWDTEFAKATITVTVKAKMRRAGLNTNSYLEQLK